MKSKMLWALICVNILLAAGAAMRWVRPSAAFAQGARRPSDYVMIPGEIPGGSGAVVYVVDDTNGMLSATTFNETRGNNGTLDVAPATNLNRLFDQIRTRH